MMKAVLIVVMVGLGCADRGDGGLVWRPRPSACGNHEPVVNPEDCTLGTATNQCGEVVCMKGPGEVCGGRLGRYGICGDGMMCSNCGRLGRYGICGDGMMC